VGEVNGLDGAEEPQDEEEGARGEQRDDGQDEPAHHDLVEFGQPRVHDDDQHEVQKARQGQVGDRREPEPQMMEDVQQADGRRDGAGHRDVDHTGAVHAGGAPPDEQEQGPETVEDREPQVRHERLLEPGLTCERRGPGSGPHEARDRCGGDFLSRQKALAPQHAAGEFDQQGRQQQKPRVAQEAPEGVLEEAVDEGPPLLEEQGEADEGKGDLDGILVLLEEQGNGDRETHRRQDEKFHKGSRPGSTKKDHHRRPALSPSCGMAPGNSPDYACFRDLAFSPS